MAITRVNMLKQLDGRLRRRRQRTDLYEAYYAGNHRLAFATEKYRDAFGSLFGAFADNWCGVVCDTPAERLSVEGFTSKNSDSADESAWDVWHENDMELQAGSAMLGAIKTGYSYVLVDVTADKPTMHVWPSSMAIVRRDPRTRKAVAGMTQWLNDDGSFGAELYLPDGTQRYKSRDKESRTGNVADPDKREWLADGEFVPNPLTDGSIPLVEFVNRPNELNHGHSELGDILALQDAINKLVNDMIVASEFQAFRQRVLTGVEIPRNPETGVPLPSQQIEAAMSRLWAFEPTDAKVWDLPATDLNNYVSGIKELLNHLAAQTRTPPHYLIGQMVNVSGEALTAAESGLVSKVESKQRSFAISWREVMKLAMKSDTPVEVSWSNPERRDVAKLADAITKLMATAQLAFPREEALRMLGFSPMEIKRIIKLMDERLPGQTGGTTAPTDPNNPPKPPVDPNKPPKPPGT